MSAVVFLFLALVLLGLLSGRAAGNGDGQQEDGSDTWLAEQLSADQCDSYWDPPGDDV